MSDTGDTLRLVAHHLVSALQPLEQAFRSESDFRRLMRDLGWDATSLPPSYSVVADEAADVVGDLNALVDGAELGEVLALIKSVGELVIAIGDVADAPAGVDAGAFLAEMPERLVEILLVDYLARELPQVYAFFEMTGVIVLEDHPAAGGRPAYVRACLRYEEIPKILLEPQTLPERIYGWGTVDLDFALIAEHLQALASAIGLLAGLGGVEPGLARGVLGGADAAYLPTTTLEVMLLEVQVGDAIEPLGLQLVEVPPVPGAAEGDPPVELAGLALLPLVPSSVGLSLPIGEDWVFEVEAGTDLASQIAIVLRPSGVSAHFPYLTGLPPPTYTFGAGVRYAPASPTAIFGRADGSRLELAGAGLNGHLTLGDGDPEVRIGLAIEGLAVVIDASDADAFLREVLGGTDIRAEVPFSLAWSSKSGLDFAAAAGFEMQLRPNLHLGPIVVDGVDLRFKAEGGVGVTPAVTIGAGLDLSLELGPLVAAASGIGIELKLQFEDGNAGPFDIEFGFKPPDGIGLSMETDIVKLGGFLKLDFENGFYAGAVELSIKDVFNLSAIGLLNAPLPGRDDGFSLLFIVSTEFPSPIHIAYNFFFTGVGGMLGLHRSADLDRLRAGVRTGALDDILFPEDVVRNMDRIVTDLQATFPPAADQFLVGPMVRLTWNIPPLLTGDFGLVVEFPNPVRIAILGLIKAAIPTEDAAIIQINVAFLGTIDFAKGLLTFDASIFDSFIGFESFKLSLAGDLALRISWGARPDFVFTIGGFHPTYTPAAHLMVSDVRRVEISLLKDNPRLSLTCYFAITTNTVQFGAALDFYFGVSEFNVVGYFGFDALFQFSPFRFIVGFKGMVAVRMGSNELFCISIEIDLEGPTPWIARGKAKFKILFFEVKVSFQVTVGEDKKTTLPDVEVLPKLVEAFERDAAWRGLLETGANRLVQTVEPELAEGQVLIDAAGVLEIEQSEVPLDTVLERFGNALPSDLISATVREVRLGGTAAATEPATEPFAPASYLAMSDRDKLQAPSFEQRPSGVRARAGSAVRTGGIVGKNVAYERLVEDANAPDGSAPVRSPFVPGLGTFTKSADGSAAGRARRAQLRSAGAERGKLARLAPAEERFSVVSAQDLVVVSNAHHALSRSEAEAALAELIRSGTPRRTIDIVPAHQATT